MSKRSRVAQLDPIRSVTPVARGVDTFVVTKPQEVDTQKLKALDALVPFLAEAGQRGLQKRAEEEKSQLTEQFTKDPAQFAADLKDGKFAGLTTPAQMLAGEYMGKRLARVYGSDLNQEYFKSSSMLNSTDENAIVPFESAFRTKFIDANTELFKMPGVTEGFASSFRGYTSALDSQHISKARDNRVAGQLSGFKSALDTTLDAYSNGYITETDFLGQIRFHQNDFMAGFGYKPSAANTSTLNAIVEYATSNILSPEKSRALLDTAAKIETSPGSFLANTVEGGVALAKARTAIDDAEFKREQQSNALFNVTQSKMKDYAQAKILEKLDMFQPSMGTLGSLELTDVFTQAQITEFQTFYPEVVRYFEDQKNFFMKESGEVLPNVEIQMSLELAKATTTEQARDMIAGWQSSGRLNNNREAYGRLWAQADKIREVAPNKEADWSTDKIFKRYYSLLSGTNLDNGFTVFAPTDPRNEVLSGFFETFVMKVYYTEEYQAGNQMERATILKTYYDQAKSLMVTLANQRPNNTSTSTSTSTSIPFTGE